ncbi:hypothetical protein AYK24_07055 [Thermoplasmatales archaeon SG8-52-4]|nr:MAG: hypothetical protein AYK24_07055 [Thermoplasmatales archaeon SG8-52-4]
MKDIGKYSIILGFIIIILGLLIIPTISKLVFGNYVCNHTNMNLVGLAIVFIGMYIVIKEKK